MRRFPHFFNAVIRLWRKWRGTRPEDIPRLMPADALLRAMEEARFLRGNGVDVRSLMPGEAPGAPKPADGAEPPPAPASRPA
ncbi:MAG: hypothetical protein EBX37_13680 [Alphaproteobacteria bacterium]|nr:hypothetical protein [Alphaproteobacteria bacterium]